MHLCMYVVDSRTKHSKKWTPGVLADATGSPENVSEIHAAHIMIYKSI